MASKQPGKNNQTTTATKSNRQPSPRHQSANPKNFSSPEERNIAYRYYVLDHLTTQQIADRMGRNRKTIDEWIAKGHWAEQRNEYTFTSVHLVATLRKLAHRIGAKLEDHDNTEAQASILKSLSEVTKLIEAFDDRVNRTPVIIELTEDLLNTIRDDVADEYKPYIVPVIIEWAQRKRAREIA